MCQGFSQWFQNIWMCPTCEQIFIFILVKPDCCLPRPPPSQANGLTLADFMSEFDSFLTDLSVIPGKLLLLGDFNFHVDTPTKTDVNGFLQVISAASLHQHVTGPTHVHVHGHTLDLVFTRDWVFNWKMYCPRYAYVWPFNSELKVDNTSSATRADN